MIVLVLAVAFAEAKVARVELAVLRDGAVPPKAFASARTTDSFPTRAHAGESVAGDVPGLVCNAHDGWVEVRAEFPAMARSGSCQVGKHMVMVDLVAESPWMTPIDEAVGTGHAAVLAAPQGTWLGQSFRLDVADAIASSSPAAGVEGVTCSVDGADAPRLFVETRGLVTSGIATCPVATREGTTVEVPVRLYALARE